MPEEPRKEEDYEAAEKQLKAIQTTADNARVVSEALQKAPIGTGSLKKMEVILAKEEAGQPGTVAALHHVFLKSVDSANNHAIRIQTHKVVDGKTVTDEAEVIGYMRVFPVSDKTGEDAKAEQDFSTAGQIYADEGLTEEVTIGSMEKDGDNRYDVFVGILADARMAVDSDALAFDDALKAISSE